MSWSAHVLRSPCARRSRLAYVLRRAAVSRERGSERGGGSSHGAKKDNFVSSFVNICSPLNRPLTYAAVNGRKDTLPVGCIIMSDIIGSFRTGFALRLAFAGAAAG